MSEKAKKCMENEKVLRLRISDEKWGPKSKFGPDISVDNRPNFPTHPGSTPGSNRSETPVFLLVPSSDQKIPVEIPSREIGYEMAICWLRARFRILSILLLILSQQKYLINSCMCAQKQYVDFRSMA